MKNKAYLIGESRIHGSGVFAARNIAKGEVIAEYLGEIISKDEALERGLKRESDSKIDGSGSVYIFELDDEFDLDGNFEYNDARLINHACRTNCETVLDGMKIFFNATRDIVEGEEILYNYSYRFEDCLNHPCRCGYPECMGYIVAAEDRSKLRKILKNKSRGKNNPKEQ